MREFCRASSDVTLKAYAVFNRKQWGIFVTLTVGGVHICTIPPLTSPADQLETRIRSPHSIIWHGLFDGAVPEKIDVSYWKSKTAAVKK